MSITGQQSELDRLGSRLALLNAENDRLKRIIVGYEKRLAEEIGNGGSSSREALKEVDRLQELSRERLAEVELWKRECAELTSELQKTADRSRTTGVVRQEVQEVVEKFKYEIEALKRELKEQQAEIERLKRGPSQTSGKENAHTLAANEDKLAKEYSRVIRNLKIEVDELKATIDLLKREKVDTVTREFHFEQLKEQEVRLLESIAATNKNSNNSSAAMVQQFQMNLNALAVENDKLAKALRQMNEREKSRSVTMEVALEVKLEKEARMRMSNLEDKINQLIDENEIIIKENDQLKYWSGNELRGPSQKSGDLLRSSKNGSNHTSNSKMFFEDNLGSHREGQLTNRIKDLETQLTSKEVEVHNQREVLEVRIHKLEKELVAVKRKSSIQSMSTHGSVEQYKHSMEEAQNLVSKMERENRLLLARIDQLEADNVNRRDDTQKLYTIIENKNKVQGDLIRERAEHHASTTQDNPAPETGATEEIQEAEEGSPAEPTPEDAQPVAETPADEEDQPAKKSSKPDKGNTDDKPRRKNTGEMLGEGTDAGAAKELLDVFSYYDRKKQGKLPIALLEEVVGSMGIAFPPPEKRESILQIADPSGSNFFTMHALKEVVSSLRGGSTKVEDVLTTYRMFDKDDKGFFTKQELKGVLLRFTSGKISDAEIDQIMTMGGPADAVDEEGNTKEASISKEVFLSLFQ